MKLKKNISGRPCCRGNAEGLARIVLNPFEESNHFKEGEILVVQQTTPDYTPLCTSLQELLEKLEAY